MMNYERDLHVVELDAVVTVVGLSASRIPLRVLSCRFSHRRFADYVGPILGGDRGAASPGVE
jgi:hypothetical protein